MLSKGLNNIVHGRAASSGCGFLITELAAVIHIPARRPVIELHTYARNGLRDGSRLELLLELDHVVTDHAKVSQIIDIPSILVDEGVTEA